MHDMLDEQIIIAIKDMLDHHNHYAQKFRMARDKLQSAALLDLKIKLISQRQTDGRLYNLPTTTEVAALIVGDEHSADKRDIIIEKQPSPYELAFRIELGPYSYSKMVSESILDPFKGSSIMLSTHQTQKCWT